MENFFLLNCVEMYRTVSNRAKCAKACKTRDNSNILHSLAQFSTVLHALTQLDTVLHALTQLDTVLHSLADTIFNCKILFLPNHSAQFGTV